MSKWYCLFHLFRMENLNSARQFLWRSFRFSPAVLGVMLFVVLLAFFHCCLILLFVSPDIVWFLFDWFVILSVFAGITLYVDVLRVLRSKERLAFLSLWPCDGYGAILVAVGRDTIKTLAALFMAGVIVIAATFFVTGMSAVWLLSWPVYYILLVVFAILLNIYLLPSFFLKVDDRSRWSLPVKCTAAFVLGIILVALFTAVSSIWSKDNDGFLTLENLFHVVSNVINLLHILHQYTPFSPFMALLNLLKSGRWDLYFAVVGTLITCYVFLTRWLVKRIRRVDFGAFYSLNPALPRQLKAIGTWLAHRVVPPRERPFFEKDWILLWREQSGVVSSLRWTLYFLFLGTGLWAGKLIFDVSVPGELSLAALAAWVYCSTGMITGSLSAVTTLEGEGRNIIRIILSGRKPKDVLRAKAVLNLVFAVPLALFFSVPLAIGILHPADYRTVLLYFAVGLVISSTAAIVHVYCSAAAPRYLWTDLDAVGDSMAANTIEDLIGEGYFWIILGGLGLLAALAYDNYISAAVSKLLSVLLALLGPVLYVPMVIWAVNKWGWEYGEWQR